MNLSVPVPKVTKTNIRGVSDIALENWVKTRKEVFGTTNEVGIKPILHHIVLTGGPCGGKSTALALVSQRLKSVGFSVYTVPEIATLLTEGGASYQPQMDQEQLISFEGSIMRAQIALEDSFLRVAEASGKSSVVISDRGTCDVKAYMKEDDFDLLLNVEGWQLATLRDRYTAVFHLVTAAIGAEEFYTRENNPSRRETLEEARSLDYRTREVWLGHPKLRIIDNQRGEAFMDKINRVVEGIFSVIGLPTPIYSERRFLIAKSPSKKMMSLFRWENIKFVEFEVEVHFLHPICDNLGYKLHPRLMKRSQLGIHTYHYSVKKSLDPSDFNEQFLNTSDLRKSNPDEFTEDLIQIITGENHALPTKVCIDEETIPDVAPSGLYQILSATLITGKQYIQLLKLKDPLRAPVYKRCRSFLFNDLYFTMNYYHSKKYSSSEFYLLSADDDSNKSAMFVF